MKKNLVFLASAFFAVSLAGSAFWACSGDDNGTTPPPTRATTRRPSTRSRPNPTPEQSRPRPKPARPPMPVRTRRAFLRLPCSASRSIAWGGRPSTRRSTTASTATRPPRERRRTRTTPTSKRGRGPRATRRSSRRTSRSSTRSTRPTRQRGAATSPSPNRRGRCALQHARRRARRQSPLGQHGLDDVHPVPGRRAQRHGPVGQHGLRRSQAALRRDPDHLLGRRRGGIERVR